MTSTTAPLPHYSCSNYRLEKSADRPYVRLTTPEGETILELFVPFGVDTVGGLDDTTGLSEMKETVTPEGSTFELEATSSVWTRKTYRIHCSPDQVRFETHVEGTGDLTEVRYFGGNYSGQPRWGSGFFWSATSLRRGFNPEPTVHEERYFAPEAGAQIDATGVPLPGRAGWFFTPPPYCLAFEGPDGWLGLGVEAQPGENRYTDLRYVAQRGAFHLSLGFDGRTRVDGSYRLPDLAIHFANGPYEALAAHVRSLKELLLVPDVPPRPLPAWWCRPIFCGWGSQSHLAARGGGDAPALATEVNYRSFLATLADNGVSPGVLVIDDKWQSTYGGNEADGAKWPDLKGFIAEQHAAGRKVLLWLKAWDPEGLPSNECVTNAAGVRVACDPTSPEYERRLRDSVRRMLGPDGYDADGFKLDFTARMPSGPGLGMHGDVWGLELMRLYLHVLYSEAKSVKPDSLLMTHTPHPYLADQLDMIRLNDINKGSDVNEAMRHRAKVARIACPHALIDTDNWPIPDRDSWRAYLPLQLELGVPSLYYSSHIDTSGEPLLREDYDLIRRVWGGVPDDETLFGAPLDVPGTGSSANEVPS